MKNYVKILNITWMITLLTSLVILIFCIVEPLVKYGRFYFKIRENMYIYLIMCALILSLITYTNKSFKSKCKKLSKQDFNNKITDYKVLCQNMYLSYLASAVVGLIYCIFLSSSESIVFAIISVLFIVLSRQNSIIVKFNLNLTEEEISKINDITIR